MYRGISKAGILAISTLLFSFSSNAQDEWASIGPKGVTATAIVFDTTGTTDKLRMTAAWDAWETSLDSPKWQAEGLNTINSPNGIVLDPLTAGGYYVTQDNTIIHVTPGSSPEILEPGDYGNELYVSPDGNTIYLLGFNTFRFSHNGGQNFYTGDIDYPDSPSVLKVDPNDPSTAYLFIQFHGDVYKTVDGGQTWSVFPTDATSPRDLVIDPADSQHIIVGGMDGIYETLNGGSTWSKLTADWATRLFANSDFSRLYLLNGSSRAFISSSTDGGSTWDEITPGVAGTAANDGNDTIYDLAAHPDQPDTLAIVQKSGVRISTDAGSSWTYLNNGIRKVAANRVALSATSDRVLLNTQYHSVQISNNAGTSWTRAVDGLELMGSESGYAAAINPVNDDVLLASTLSKIVRSTDGGASWSNVYEDLEYAFDIDFIGDAGEVIVGQQSSVLYSADSGATFDVISSGDIPFALVYSVDASPGDTWRIFATGGDGLQYTDDLGTSWTLATEFATREIEVAPSNPDRVYLTDLDGGFHRSTDRGASFEALSSPIIGIARIAVHPTNEDIVFLIGTGVNNYVSLDGGDSFGPLSEADLGLVYDVEYVLDETGTDHLWVASNRSVLNVSPASSKTEQQKQASAIVENQESLSALPLNYSAINVGFDASQATSSNSTSFAVDVSAVDGIGALGIELTLSASSGLSLTSGSGEGWSCTVSGQVATCNIDTLYRGQLGISVGVSSDTDTTHTIDVSATAATAGTISVANSGKASITFEKSSGGGGGALGLAGLFALAGLAMARRRLR